MASRSSERQQQPRYPAERRDLQCGDCSAPLQLRETAKGTFYGCTRYPACRGCLGAHPDGSPVGTPADAATRRARHLTHELFDKLWREGHVSRTGAYAWLQRALNMSVDEAHIGKFDIPTCRRLYVLAREQLRVLSADPTCQARAALRLSLQAHFGRRWRVQRGARKWLSGVLGISGDARVGDLSIKQCDAANATLAKIKHDQFWGTDMWDMPDADDDTSNDEPLPMGCDD